VCRSCSTRVTHTLFIAQNARTLAKTTSKLVAETMTERLSLFNSVRLIWVSRHFNVPGSEIAEMASKAAYEGFIGPEPRIGIAMTTVRTEVQSWADSAHLRLSQSSDGCRQVKMFLKGPDKHLSRFALDIKRKQVRLSLWSRPHSHKMAENEWRKSE